MFLHLINYTWLRNAHLKATLPSRSATYAQAPTSSISGPRLSAAAIPSAGLPRLVFARSHGTLTRGFRVVRRLTDAPPCSPRSTQSASTVGALVVAKRDRLARDVVLAAMIEQLAARQGARVISAAGEGTDGDEHDPSAQLMRRLVDAFAEYERALIRARTKAALGVKRRRHERVGTVPFGYTLAIDGVRLEPLASEQAVIARALALSASGLSTRAIATTLRADGIAGRSGQALSQTQVSRLLRSASRAEAA